MLQSVRGHRSTKRRVSSHLGNMMNLHIDTTGYVTMVFVEDGVEKFASGIGTIAESIDKFSRVVASLKSIEEQPNEIGKDPSGVHQSGERSQTVASCHYVSGREEDAPPPAPSPDGKA